MTTYAFTPSAARPQRSTLRAARASVRPPTVAPSRLRLTARGRLVLTSLATLPLVVGIGMVSLNGGAATATNERSNVTFQYVQIESGESLWTLAQSIAPTADPRAVIADIVNLNQLTTPVVQPGQSIAIPTKYEH